MKRDFSVSIGHLPESAICRLFAILNSLFFASKLQPLSKTISRDFTDFCLLPDIFTDLVNHARPHTIFYKARQSYGNRYQLFITFWDKRESRTKKWCFMNDRLLSSFSTL